VSDEYDRRWVMTRPNIIFILVDQMRGDCLGADGNSRIDTPNLDYLAARGTRFRHAYTACPSCIPARASIWTGMNQWHTGVLGMSVGQGQIRNDYPNILPQMLTQNGYRTHLVGKGHFFPQRSMMGFETHELDESGRVYTKDFKDDYRAWFEKEAKRDITPDDHGVFFNSWHARPWHTEEYLHPSAWTMSRSIDFLSKIDPERPFFLNISFARPHSPYVPPEYYFNMYDQRGTPKPHIGSWASMHECPEEAIDPNAARGRMTPEQIHRARSGYYGEISFIDTQIGRLLNWYGRYQPKAFANTWFVFTSDHGDMQGDHNLWRKSHAYEGSARIPFFVTPPKALQPTQRRVSDEVIELRDFMPTVLDIAGIDKPRTVDGQSLLPLTQGKAKEWRSYIHGEHSMAYREQEMQYITNGRRKFIWFPRLDQEQFFNLEKDPAELKDLSRNRAYSKEVAHYRNILIRELETRNCGWAKNGKLVCPKGDEPLISPYRDQLWQGK
jgi:arylsulfatase